MNYKYYESTHLFIIKLRTLGLLGKLTKTKNPTFINNDNEVFPIQFEHVYLIILAYVVCVFIPIILLIIEVMVIFHGYIPH